MESINSWRQTRTPDKDRLLHTQIRKQNEYRYQLLWQQIKSRINDRLLKKFSSGWMTDCLKEKLRKLPTIYLLKKQKIRSDDYGLRNTVKKEDEWSILCMIKMYNEKQDLYQKLITFWTKDERLIASSSEENITDWLFSYLVTRVAMVEFQTICLVGFEGLIEINIWI